MWNEEPLKLNELYIELKRFGASICTVTMHWNEEREQYMMRLAIPSAFVQEFKEEEIAKCEKDYFDCMTTQSFFKGLDKTNKKKYKLILVPEND